MMVMLMAVLPAASSFWRTRSYAATVAIAIACAAPLVRCGRSRSQAPHPCGPMPGSTTSRRRAGAMCSRTKAASACCTCAHPALVCRAPRAAAAWALWRSRRTLAARTDLLLPLAAFAAFFIVASVFGEARDVNALRCCCRWRCSVPRSSTPCRAARLGARLVRLTTFLLFAACSGSPGGAVTGKPDFAVAWLSAKCPLQVPLQLPRLRARLAVTLIWLVVVARSLRSTRRAVVNWTAGIAMIWMLMMTLGVPLVDQARSYRALSSRVAQNLPPNQTCIARKNVGDGQRALLDYFVQLRTIREDSPTPPVATSSCCRRHRPSPRGGRPLGGDLARLAAGDRHELFILYQRL